jgi:uncharacterized protein (DUF1786 family)
MSRILAIDIGAGTMDVLYFDTESEFHYKAVVRSPVRTIAERVRLAPGTLLVVGVEMGGGAVSQAVKRRAAAEKVLISETAAMTISHDLEKVRALGLEVIDDERSRELLAAGNDTPVTLGDLELDRIQGIVEGFGVPFDFDVVGVCVQDHGVAPAGVSHLDYRHNHFRPILDAQPTPDALLYSAEEVPEDMSRLRAVRDVARSLPSPSIFVMDSGMAAILGATLDPRVRDCERAIVLDVATSHTVAASFDGDELCGFVEYHTKDIKLERMDSLLKELADGRLEHAQILAEGGHGAYTRRALGFDSVEIILSTGPRRALLDGSSLEIVRGAPLGDNMMTGTAGLLEAIRRRQGFSIY